MLLVEMAQEIIQVVLFHNGERAFYKALSYPRLFRAGR